MITKEKAKEIAAAQAPKGYVVGEAYQMEGIAIVVCLTCPTAPPVVVFVDSTSHAGRLHFAVYQNTKMASTV